MVDPFQKLAAYDIVFGAATNGKPEMVDPIADAESVAPPAHAMLPVTVTCRPILV
jgi:hypothetical protein